MSNQQITKNIMIMERQKALNQYRAEVASYEQYGTSSVVSFEEWLEIKGIHLDDELSIEEKAKLSIEQKAKRYDEALKEAVIAHKDEDRHLKATLERIFPELTESEDERIRKLCEILVRTCFMNELCTKEDKDDCIAWLEKQGNKPQGKSALEAAQEEKVDNQNCVKLADKIEPTFKVGDWVVFKNKHQSIYQVEKIEDGYYILRHTHGGTFRVCVLHDESLRLWTIEDAKDGDVLACNEEILLFKSYSVQGRISLYCWYNGRTNNFHSKGVADTLLTTRNKIYPTTKKHRDRLFHKMKEAGYMWDAEKKELKKIEDENYDGEDYGIDSLFHAQRILEKTLGKVDGYQTDDGILSHKCAITAVNKLYKQKSAWSEEDEMFVHGLIRGLSAKRDIHGHTTFSSDCIDITETINWLKSLKDRYAWKPSDE